MLRHIFGAAVSVMMLVQGAQAEGRSVLGAGYLVANDVIGAGIEYDRWRTGSAVFSLALGESWDGQAPETFGSLLEVRLAGEIIAPMSLEYQLSWDRRYATSVSLGVHTHVQVSGLEASVGADVVAIGPQTNLDEIQSWIHRNADMPLPSQMVQDAQIQNTWRLRGVVEVGSTYSLSNTASLRPFAEIRTGDETLARVGFDATLGRFGQGELLARDSVTGHRYSVIRDQHPGWSAVFGADVTRVFNSVYLPEVDGLQRSEVRARARAGLHWRGERTSIFYGVSYLSEEFEAQPEGQFVGAINLTYQF